MGIVEAQQAGHFFNSVSFHQKVLCLVYHEGVDIADGGAACSLMDHIAKVTGGIGRFTGAVCNCWKAFFVLQTF